MKFIIHLLEKETEKEKKKNQRQLKIHNLGCSQDVLGHVRGTL